MYILDTPMRSYQHLKLPQLSSFVLFIFIHFMKLHERGCCTLVNDREVVDHIVITLYTGGGEGGGGVM